MRELTRLLTAQGQLDHPGDRHLPGLADSIRDTLERRLARLSQPCVDVLAVVAVAGREARLDVLARVAGDAEERAGHDHAARMAGLLAEATAARVLAEPAGPLAPRRFVHDLFRETVDAGLASGERVRLHLAVGHALEALRAEGTPVHAAELAALFLAAAPAGVAAEAVRWSALAAEEATARLAFEDARATWSGPWPPWTSLTSPGCLCHPPPPWGHAAVGCLGRPEDDQAVIVVATWSYIGSGYQTTGEAWLAASAAARAREARRIAKENYAP